MKRFKHGVTEGTENEKNAKRLSWKFSYELSLIETVVNWIK